MLVSSQPRFLASPYEQARLDLAYRKRSFSFGLTQKKSSRLRRLFTACHMQTDLHNYLSEWPKINYINNGFWLLPLQGAMVWCLLPRTLPWAKGVMAFQAVKIYVN